ncbi:DNA ligase [Erwinia phage Rouille]|uniref:Gp092 n=1 Tax=Erwinia phage vB_Eam-MM7 TaxID=1051674 RepID=G0YPS4_9CAUD|nr:gp092 [Erwinia phage vB_Eam-MM7]AEJ81351.1 gp092 [Erwinia phage vB_Eam-MM7]UNA01065.1 hypothetical protein 1Hena2_00115 [Erwinia phage Hena2]WJN64857.1 DNA ligase [Erwinia phage Rouille]WLW39311.1 hypothetical protein [Erwinia phage vB_EamM-BoyaciRG1]
MRIDKDKAVLDDEGCVKSFTLLVGGKDFFCNCGCNCFHKPDRNDLSVYSCNGCHKTYKRVDQPRKVC